MCLPVRVVVDREEPLNGLGPSGAWFEQGLYGLSELGQSPVGHLPGLDRMRGSVEAVQRGGQIKDPAPRLQKVTVQDLGQFARYRDHRDRSRRVGRVQVKRIILVDHLKSSKRSQIDITLPVFLVILTIAPVDALSGDRALGCVGSLWYG